MSAPTLERPGRPAAAPAPTGRAPRRRPDPFKVVGWAVCAAVCLAILYPIAILLRDVAGLGQTPSILGDIKDEALAPGALETLRTTVLLVVPAGLVALLIASLLAWINERTDARIGALADVTPILPMFIPPVAGAIGWVFGAVAAPMALASWANSKVVGRFGLRLVGHGGAAAFALVTAVVLLREWGVTLLRLSVLKQVVIPAARRGKIKTVLQAIALAGLTWPLPHGDAHGGAFDFWPGPLGEVLFYVGQVLLAGAVAMTLWSGWEFVREVRRQRSGPR